MWKFSLILFAMASSITGEYFLDCQGDFHQICGLLDVLLYVTQGSCDDLTFGDDVGKRSCQVYLEPKLTLNVQDFSSITPFAFKYTNFTKLQLLSTSEDCERKTINSTSESFDDLSSVIYLTLDCVAFPKTRNLFKNFVSVAHLNMSRLDLTSMPNHFLSDFPRLRCLTLDRINITAITSTTFSTINRQLKYLYLRSNNLSIIEGRSFEKLHNLRELKIEDNHLTHLESYMLEGLNRLESLILDNNDITVLRINFLSTLPRLRVLSLSKNKIKELGTESLPKLVFREIEVGGSPHSLVILDLSDNELEDLPAGVFKNLPILKSLSLEGNKIKFVRKNSFNGLRHLNLARNHIEHIEPTAFRGLHLQYLHLDHNKLSVLEPDTFNGLHLDKDLALSCNNITEIEERAFRNLTASWIYLPPTLTRTDRESWDRDSSIEEFAISYASCKLD